MGRFALGFFLMWGFFSACLVGGNSEAQVGTFTKEALVEYTPLWKGERFPDGRPKVPDDILRRMKKVSIEEAWNVCEKYGYVNQYEGGWKTSISNPKLVGRAYTVLWMPRRPDIDDKIWERAKKDGRVGVNQNYWVIDPMVENDVMVVSCMRKIDDGPIAGDNLISAMYGRSRAGLVCDGSVRDLDGVLERLGENFPIFVRDWHPSVRREIMVMGINHPLSIGAAICMPGDVVLGGREGVIFIPPHMAQEIVEKSEAERVHDDFTSKCLIEKKYLAGEIYGAKWTDALWKEFKEYLETRTDLTPADRKRIYEYPGMHGRQ